MRSVSHRVEAIALSLAVAVIDSLQAIQFVIGVNFGAVSAFRGSDLIPQAHTRSVIGVVVLNLIREVPHTVWVLVIPSVFELVENMPTHVIAAIVLVSIIGLVGENDAQVHVEGLVKLDGSGHFLPVESVQEMTPLTVSVLN